MRESQLREAPYPKSKNMDKKKDDVYIDVEDKDPVWLKDKGDHFFKRADYNGAINAYSKALKADPDFLAGRLNRATCFIKIRQYRAAGEDCDDIIAAIAKLKEEVINDDRTFYMKLLARAHTKRAAAYSWCSNFEAAMDSFDKVLSSEEFAKIIGAENIANLHKDKARVQQRMKSNAIKQDGDR
jgi:tetratricopeptide (TPR) repeat protein